MLSIYQKGFTEKICVKYCNGIKKDKVEGMVIWIAKRVTKFCKSSKKEIKDLKSKLTDNKIEDILKARPDELIIFWKEFERFKDLRNKIKDENTILENIFDYSTFRGYRATIINGFWLATELGVNCCPYCNRNYTTSHQQNYNLIKKENKYVFPCFDHFYPKEVYPLLALSFYNLIPSCTVCNSDYKGAKDPNSVIENNFKILNPYTEFINDHFSFDFIPEDYNSLVGKDKIIDLKINYKNQLLRAEFEKSIILFGILENYQNHVDLIQNIIDKKITFSDNYIANIESLYGLDFNETYKILFETHYEDDRLCKLPFSKLKKDIYDKLEELKKKSVHLC